jgi:hypothetical protein
MGPEIIALMIALAGAAVQYKASSDAQSRQKDEIGRAQASQRALQLQAEQKALGAASKFATPDRVKEQDQIAEQITADLIVPVSENQTLRAAGQGAQGDVSGDYKTAKAASDLNAIKSAEALARMMGKTSSSQRLRMNEGIRLMDTGQQIGTLGSFSRGQAGADNIAIGQAGQIDPGMQFAGSALQSIGSAGMAYGGAGSGSLASATGDAGTDAAIGLSPYTTSAYGAKTSPYLQAYNRLFSQARAN